MKTPLEEAIDQCVANNPHRLQAAKIVQWIRDRAALIAIDRRGADAINRGRLQEVEAAVRARAKTRAGVEK